jgi:hypothetical protein
MFIEAIDKLRCVQQHEDSWLVAKFVEMRDRDFWEGELGCPVCEARYPVHEGVVYFTPIRKVPQTEAARSHSPDEMFALAAMLDLSAPDRVVVLCGAWSAFASGLSEVSEPHIFLVNGELGPAGSECIHSVVSDTAIPLAHNSVDAVALPAVAAGSFVQSAVAVLKEGGRLVGTSETAIPPGMLQLASDDRNWVARKQGDIIPLRRASR